MPLINIDTESLGQRLRAQVDQAIAPLLRALDRQAQLLEEQNKLLEKLIKTLNEVKK